MMFISSLLMRFPFQGPKSSFKDWWNLTWRQRWPALWGALSWALGTVAYNLAGPSLGYAVAFVIGQSNPFISSLFALFYWHEFRNAGAKTWVCEVCMLLLYASSIGLIGLTLN